MKLYNQSSHLACDGYSDCDIKLELQNGISVFASSSPSSGVLLRFLEGYDRAFVLVDEREEPEDFQRCLAQNRMSRHAFGLIHSELVAVFEDTDGNLLAGANFLATSVHPTEHLPQATVALNYVYVEPLARGKGMLRIILNTIRELSVVALGLSKEGLPPVIFIEQNDPLALTVEEYNYDTSHSGLDQIERLAMWESVGARIIDFPYVQPALSASKKSNSSLLYAVIDYPDRMLDLRLFYNHLQSFIYISVLKGEADTPDGVASSQLTLLSLSDSPLRLLTIQKWLPILRTEKQFRRYKNIHDFLQFCLAETTSN